MAQNITVANVRHAAHRQPGPIDYRERGLLLTALDTEGVAVFLLPLSWAERAAWFDGLVADGLAWAAGDVRGLRMRHDEARHFVVRTASDMRAKIADVLDRLDQLRPLSYDEHAMRLFRVAADPGRVEMTRRHWRTRTAEAAAFTAGSGLAMLRDLVIAEAGLRATRRPGRAMVGRAA